MKALISCRDFMLRKIFQYFLMGWQNFIKSWIRKNFLRHVLIHNVQNIGAIQNKKYIINYLMNSFDDASGNLVVQVPGYLLKLLFLDFRFSLLESCKFLLFLDSIQRVFAKTNLCQILQLQSIFTHHDSHDTCDINFLNLIETWNILERSLLIMIHDSNNQLFELDRNLEYSRAQFCDVERQDLFSSIHLVLKTSFT